MILRGFRGEIISKMRSEMVLVLVILNGEVVRSCQGQPVKLSHLVGKKNFGIPVSNFELAQKLAVVYGLTYIFMIITFSSLTILRV